MHSRLPTKQHLLYTTLLYTETWSFLLLGTHTRHTIHKKTQDTRQGNPISICSVSLKLQCVIMLIISKSFLSRNYLKFENEKWNLDWTYLPNSAINTVKGRFITVKTFQAQQRSDQNVLSSVELIQNISKINPKYMQRDLARNLWPRIHKHIQTQRW